MQDVVHYIQQKYSLQCPKSDKTLEFLVLFNDQPSNDFNTLFKSLPRETPYFAAGVPGSFHRRLFPASSVHFVHCSFALHWLSKVPEELQDKNSIAWYKGRIHYSNASNEVVRAYAARFSEDMEDFLCARATEIVSGGMMVISMPGIPNEMTYSQLAASLMYEFMASSFMDMANEGLISEDEVDSFNLPIYTPSPEEMTTAVETNGQFSIEILELINSASLTDGRVDIKAWIVHVRAAMEGMFIKHFGSDIVDEIGSKPSERRRVFGELHCFRAALEGMFIKHFGSDIVDEMFDRLTTKLFMFSDRNKLLDVLIRK
ncbi:loganic acid O-methyltransferase-like [Hibiscus syriacus]|uniref:loganic acid O-methyltransferase-like n=1 Tax=Hibiscus syriacus TaxID=106335 RepID=UPI0019240D1C|nr:loganic acid O-methyltransferase-like [Hibiscus syriacus]